MVGMLRADHGETTGPVLNLNMESLLSAANPLAIRNPAF